MVSVFDRAKTDGIGFRYGVSLGNQSDLEICDFLEFMIEDPGTKAICLYIEGLLDGARFCRAAAACRAAGKPLLVLKTGRTAAGIVAAKSHTASLAGSWETFTAVCREHGVSARPGSRRDGAGGPCPRAASGKAPRRPGRRAFVLGRRQLDRQRSGNGGRPGAGAACGRDAERAGEDAAARRRPPIPWTSAGASCPATSRSRATPRASCSRTRRWTTASAFSCRCRSISSAAWR